MSNGGLRFSLFPALGSGTASSTVQPASLVLVDMPTPGGGFTTQVATVQQFGAAYWNNGLSSQAAGMVSWNGTTLLSRRIVASSSNIVINNGDGSANVGVDLSTTLDFTQTTVTGGVFYNPLLVGVTFSGQSLSGGVWSNGTFSGVTNGTGWTLSGGTLSGSTALSPTISAGTLSGSTIRGATLTGTITNAVTISGGVYAKTVTVVVATQGGTVTMSAGQTNLCLAPASTLTSLVLLFPPSPVEGQPFGIGATQIITGLTMSGGSAATVTGTLASISTAQCPQYTYRSTDATWYRTAL